MGPGLCSFQSVGGKAVCRSFGNEALEISLGPVIFCYVFVPWMGHNNGTAHF